MPKYYENEFGIKLCFTVRNKVAGTVFNLGGYTIKFYMWLPSATTPKIDTGTVDVDVAADGTCHYDVVLGDFDTPGSYNWELVLTQLGIELHARGDGNITIKEEHP